MLDFEKLNSMTAEDRAKARAESDRALQESNDAIIKDRTAKIVYLVQNLDSLDSWSQRFVQDMHRISSVSDLILGEIGGGLVTLSDKQVAVLERLHSKTIEADSENQAPRFGQ